MPVSPVAFAFQTLEEVLKEARASAEVTHNHPEGIRGAQATAAATFLARQGNSKNKIRSVIEKQFSYDLSRSTATI
jgi:ADP-ribosylglycohydrolase